jgi:hypothetical protein
MCSQCGIDNGPHCYEMTHVHVHSKKREGDFHSFGRRRTSPSGKDLPCGAGRACAAQVALEASARHTAFTMNL